MNILLVDDEALSVESIASSIDWQSLGICEVYKAYSMHQAQEIFARHKVDILLCDIEMPKGTGIDLVEWMRGMNYETVCIFLTCYSRFEYASTAIRLKIFDYVLKPCEYSVLTDVILRCVEFARKSAEDRIKQRQGEYWHEDYDRVVTSFWEQLLKGTLKVSEETLPRQLALHHLDTAMADGRYYLFVLEAVPDRDIEAWENDLLGYAVRNIVLEMLDTRIMYVVRNNSFVIIKDASGLELPDFEKSCIDVVKTLSATLPSEFFGCFDEPCGMANAAEIYRRLSRDAQNRYSLKSMVFRYGQPHHNPSLPKLDPEHWQNALLGQNTDLILEEIRDLLGVVGDARIVDRNLLQVLYHQLLKAVYFVLNLHHLPAHQPFLDKYDVNAFQSIPDFEVWAEDVLENTTSLLSSQEASSTLVNTLRQYIRDNMDSDLSRSQIANVVHLNPDYLSTLFRKKSGYSLSQFVNMERIMAAKQLLLSTDLPINEIAIRTGFQNISYFSKQFKRLENQTPQSYRKRKH